MKLSKYLRVLLLVAGIVGSAWLSGADAASVITEPVPEQLIDNRVDFGVAWSIDDFYKARASGAHYWISIASIRGQDVPDLHWPKFYIKAAQANGRVSDGGQNPLPTPQRMVLLLLRVDDATNQHFTAWLQQGAGGGYPGLRVKTSDIVARVPITFP